MRILLGKRISILNVTKEINGKLYEKIYHRKPEWTHFIRIANLNMEDIESILLKMDVIHAERGHQLPNQMILMCKHYSEEHLGYTLAEALIYKKYGKCRACLEGKTILRKKDSTGRLIFVEYYLYGNMEGVHIDVFYINDKYAFLLGISHKFKMRWTFDVGKDFKALDIQEALELIFGDYRTTGNAIGFIRGDADPKFQPLRGWLQIIGLRLYMAPAGIKTSKAERGIRTEKEMIRTLVNELQYIMPEDWIPFVVKEATYLLTIQFHEKLGKSPRESFFNEHYDYKSNCTFKFGDIISYPDCNK